MAGPVGFTPQEARQARRLGLVIAIVVVFFVLELVGALDEELDGRWDHQDVEVTTVHYRGSRGSAVARSGFSCYRGSSVRLGGGGGGGRGGRSPDPRLAEEFLD